MRNRIETKMAVARTMLTKPPFRRWPLHVRVFTPDAWRIWNEFKLVGEEDPEPVPPPKIKGVKKAPVKRKTKADERRFDPLPEVATVMLDLGGVDGQGKGRTDAVRGVTKLDGPIDVEDTEYRGMVWAKWKAFRRDQPGTSGSCSVCKGVIEDVDVSSGRVLNCRDLFIRYRLPVPGPLERRLLYRSKGGPGLARLLCHRPSALLGKTLSVRSQLRGNGRIGASAFWSMSRLQDSDRLGTSHPCHLCPEGRGKGRRSAGGENPAEGYEGRGTGRQTAPGRIG